MKEAAREALRQGAVRVAGEVVARELARIGRPALGFEWSEGHPSTSVAARLLEGDHRLVEATPEQRRSLAEEFALGSLIGEPPTGRRLEELLGGPLRCPALQTFLMNAPSPFVRSFMREQADLYALTIVGAAEIERAFEEIRRAHAAGVSVLGVTIIPSGELCKLCGVEPIRYRWSYVPKVPRHWGCRCAVSAWIEE